jgi:hypothetical protein
MNRQMIARKIARQVHFVLCGSCYWCASDLAGGMMDKCPVCSYRLESTLAKI